MIGRSLILIGLSIGIGLLLAAWHPRAVRWQPPDAGSVTSAEARALDEQGCVIWLDARAPERFAADHLPNAVSCHQDDWQAGLDTYLQKWQPGCHTIVYCDGAGCQASSQVAERLRQETGFTDILALRGDWRALP